MKKIISIFTVILLISLFILPTFSYADNVTVERKLYADNGDMEFTFSGLSLDTSAYYEFGLTSNSNDAITDWHRVTQFNETTAVINLLWSESYVRDVVHYSDTGYITIRNQATQEIVLPSYAINLKRPFLQVSNYTVLQNGADIDNKVKVPICNAKLYTAYYQYEKITDQEVIQKYQQIKSQNGNVLTLQDKLKTTPPFQNWIEWDYFNGYFDYEFGFGHPVETISVPDTGLYYMWLYFVSDEAKPVYGYILVDNLSPDDIMLESISLPKTATVELGKTLTLSPVFNPQNTTHKLVTYTSSDESVATVDNTGKVTPKKVGSTIITVTSQDSDKKASCTVTVTPKNSNSTNNGSNSGTSNIVNGGTSNNGSSTAPGSFPAAGLKIGAIILLCFVLIGGSIAFIHYRKLKEIK